MYYNYFDNSRGDFVDRIEELELLIEQLKTTLSHYLDDERPKNEIYELSTQIDELIVEYSNLTKKIV